MPDKFGPHQFEQIQEIDGVVLIHTNIHWEKRGSIFSLYREGTWPHVPGGFVEEKASQSERGTLRGFHGDLKAYKLVSCLSGDVQLALVDARPTSKTYGRTWHIVLDDMTRYQVLIPPGVLNAHLCLSKRCLFHYKQSAIYRGPEGQLAIRWDSIGIPWEVDVPTLSPRDTFSGTLDSLDYSKTDRDIVVAVSGYFNPMHTGHLSLFREAKKLGDRLLVIVNNDSQRKLKGSVPFMSENERKEMVAAIGCVDDAVIAIDIDLSVSETLKLTRPDIFIWGEDTEIKDTEYCNVFKIKLVNINAPKF